MGLKWATWAALPLALAIAEPALASKAEVVVDVSGSIQGFHQAGSLSLWVDQHRKALEAAGFEVKVLALVGNQKQASRFVPWDAWKKHVEFGDLSPLPDVVKARWGDVSCLSLITDNVQNASEKEEKSDAFLASFDETSVAFAYAVPTLKAFDGPIYLPLGAAVGAYQAASPELRFAGARTNGKNQVVDAHGKRPLVAYVLSKQGAEEKSYFKALVSLRDATKDAPLLVRPIGAKHFNFVPVRDVREVEARRAKHASTASQNLPPLLPPNLVIYPEGKPDQTRSGALAPLNVAQAPVFAHNQANLAVFYFGLTTGLDHLVIGQQSQGPEGRVSISLSEPHLQVASMRSVVAGQAGQVSPPNLVEAISSASTASEAFLYQAAMRFGPWPPSWQLLNPSSWFQAMKPSPADMTVAVKLHVPAAGMALAPSTFERYWSKNPLRLDRLTAVEDPISYLNHGQLDIVLNLHMDQAQVPAGPQEAAVRPWRFSVAADPTAAVPPILLGLALLGGGVWFWRKRQARRPAQYGYKDGLVRNTPAPAGAGFVPLALGDAEQKAPLSVDPAGALQLGDGWRWEDDHLGLRHLVLNEVKELVGPDGQRERFTWR